MSDKTRIPTNVGINKIIIQYRKWFDGKIDLKQLLIVIISYNLLTYILTICILLWIHQQNVMGVYMTSFYLKLGKRIKELREKSGMSQQKLALLLKIPRPAVSQIESGLRTITAEELIKLSNVFRIHIETLLDLKKEPEVTFDEEKTSKAILGAPQIRINIPQENVNKFKEVLLYILDKVGSKPNIGETVIYKLLFFMDFDFYEKYEEQLIGAKYMKNHFGPTPVEFAKIVENMISQGELERIKSKYFDYPQTKYLPVRKPDLSKLNALELETIEDVLNKLSDMNASQISKYSHDDIPWKTTNDGSIIEYETVFYRTPAYSVREYKEDDQ
jgi:transcriptional regulator with XRE-family HTH domain